MYDLREVYFGLISNFGESQAIGCDLWVVRWDLTVGDLYWMVMDRWIGSGIDSGTVNFSVYILCIQKYLSFLPNVWQLKTTGVLWERRKQFMFNMLINYCLLFLLKKKKNYFLLSNYFTALHRNVYWLTEREREIGRKVPMRVASVCERFI